MADSYDGQDRGSDGAYDRYLRGMDASMRQKVALTAAHLLCEGQIADMGMGSGGGSFALASLYPDLEVVGVDVNPTMVERASERYQLPNLRFVEGDIAKPCFEPGSLEAILDSSVLHHVTSFNGYDRGAAARALAEQVQQLDEGGVLIVRDFVDPGAGAVWLDLPTSDGEGDAPESCSTATLFERFAREFRILREPAERGFAYTRRTRSNKPLVRPGFRRYEVSHTHATEFVLRKDYRASWAVEVQEEYTYATQQQLEATFAELGLRVLASTPIRNPWIVNNRFVGKLLLWKPVRDDDAEPLDFPATNYVIVGQKVAAGEGVRFVERSGQERLGFLELTYFRHDDGQVYDLVHRPGDSVDVLPWFRQNGALFVLARRSYPRPILGCDGGSTPMDGANATGYVSEPLNALQGDESPEKVGERLLAGFDDMNIVGELEPGASYYPSPGGIQERVRSVLVPVEPVNARVRLHGGSGFSTSGTLRAIESRQLLRAAQVGGLPDARLELNTYELLLRQRIDPGDWIGERIELSDAEPTPSPPTTVDALLAEPRQKFRPAWQAASTGFLELRCSTFAELDAHGTEIAEQTLELVVPRPYGINTVALAPLWLHNGEIYLGVDDDDLPAAQCFTDNSQLLVAPAWRLPRTVEGIGRTRAFIRDRLRLEYGIACNRFFDLGGRYHPSAGLTPEVVYPMAAAVQISDQPSAALRSLHWVVLRDAVAQRELLVDGHLRIVAMRAAHALGVLSSLLAT
jgi:SAM-dependent methyltransferase